MTEADRPGEEDIEEFAKPFPESEWRDVWKSEIGEADIEYTSSEGLVVYGYDIGEWSAAKKTSMLPMAELSGLHTFIVGDLLITAEKVDPTTISPASASPTSEHLATFLRQSSSIDDRTQLDRDDGVSVLSFDWSRMASGRRLDLATRAVAGGLTVKGSDEFVTVKGRLPKTLVGTVVQPQQIGKPQS